MMRPTKFLRPEKTLLRMKKGLRLNSKMFSDRTYMSLQWLDQSPVNDDSSRRLSQKAAYMADTPSRKRKDHIGQRWVYPFPCQPCIAHLLHSWMCHSAVKNHTAKSVVVDTPMEDTNVASGAVFSSKKKRPVPYVIQLFSRCSVHIFCLCRRPTKKPVAVPAAVKLEQDSDVDPSSVSQRSKGKAPARLESPIVITTDDEDSDQISDTPKKRPVPYVIQFFGLHSFHNPSLQAPNYEAGDYSCCKARTGFRHRTLACSSPVEGKSPSTFGIPCRCLKRWTRIWPALWHSEGKRMSLWDYRESFKTWTIFTPHLFMFPLWLMSSSLSVDHLQVHLPLLRLRMQQKRFYWVPLPVAASRIQSRTQVSLMRPPGRLILLTEAVVPVWMIASATNYAQFDLLILIKHLLTHLPTCVILIPTNPSFFRAIFSPPCLRSRCCRMFF